MLSKYTVMSNNNIDNHNTNDKINSIYCKGAEIP